MLIIFLACEDESRADLPNSLHEWLKRSDQLVQSPVELVPRPGSPGEMGAVSDLVLNLHLVEAAAAVSVIRTWLRSRRVDLDVEETAKGDIKVRFRGPRDRELGAPLAEVLRRIARDRDTDDVDGS